MSERLNKCPECKSTNVEVEKLINPETHDLNCDAILICRECGHSWQGKETSPYYEDQRNKGYVR